jgi:hypothetical protein
MPSTTVISSMSSSRALAVALMFAAPAAVAAPACPAYVHVAGGDHALADASLFDGPPAELADLEPVDGGWDLRDYAKSPRPLFLVCRYRATKEIKTVEVPRGTPACRVHEVGGATLADCG